MKYNAYREEFAHSFSLLDINILIISEALSGDVT